jgi:hypothetical protein
MSRLISRDPFAREELHRKTVLFGVLGHECRWCGAIRDRLFQYELQTDGGRTHAIFGDFCGIDCMRSYHSGVAP